MRARIDDGAWSLGSTGSSRAGQRPEAYGLRGMVASGHPVAALIGATVLQQGGNAFDAAVAVAAAEGVVLPMMCGLGGDAFVVLHDARRKELVSLNGSGVAAAGATREYYASRGYRTMPLEGVHAVGVPGAVSVYETLWKRWGTLPWADLWAPAIRLAEDGVAITEHVSRRIAERADLLARDPRAAQQFLPGGRPPAPGHRWASPDLAKTWAVAAARDALPGELTSQLLAFLRARRDVQRRGLRRPGPGLPTHRHRLPRRHGLRDRPALPGLPPPRAAQHPGGLRPPRARSRRGRPDPPPGRGQEAGLRRPEPPRGGPRVRPLAAGHADLEAPRRPAAGRDRPDPGRDAGRRPRP
jgi:hypothetical protein